MTAATPALTETLARLDELLYRAVQLARELFGSPGDDPYRGLYIADTEVDRLLNRPPGDPDLFAIESPGTWRPDDRVTSRLVWLQGALGLSDFDVDALLIALAPDLDLRYERIYAYLQDDVTRKRATVDLALNLLTPDAATKLAGRSRFVSSAPLVRHRLVHLVPDPHRVSPPRLSHYLQVDEQVTRMLLEEDGLDARLISSCHTQDDPVGWDALCIAPAVGDALRATVRAGGAEPIRLYLSGPRDADQRRTARAVAGELGRGLLVANLAAVMRAKQAERPEIFGVLVREAWFGGRVLYVDGIDHLQSDDEAAARLFTELGSTPAPTILAGRRAALPPALAGKGFVSVALGAPSSAQRRACWAASLRDCGADIPLEELSPVAERFRLAPDQIAAAATGACQQAAWREGRPLARPTRRELFDSARAEFGGGLERLTHKIEPRRGWDDLALPEDTLEQLREMVQEVVHRTRVLEEWGFGRKVARSRGVSALFSGPSGTGKTTAAEVVASELGLDLYTIDLSGVISKYIGETEKNLERIFAEGDDTDAVLFFDEADALFGKRSEVRDSHDRYANVETSYLLQRMEQYEGVAILATNLRQNMDPAFMRRLHYVIEFPFPDEAIRREIWRLHIPADAPCGADLDFQTLAEQFRIAGANIRNIALSAAYLAASNGGVIDMAHVRAAARREYQKMGKVMPEGDAVRVP